MYDSTFGKRRMTREGRTNMLEPLVMQHSDFLRRGGGHGGSPTNFDIGRHVD